MKVAILDDDILFCGRLKDYLSKYHFSIEIYNNYNELDKVIDEIDLLFLDIEMPDVNGIDLVKELAYKHLDIIFVSSHEELIRKCFNRNVVGFVYKGCLEDIDEIVDGLLDRDSFIVVKDGREIEIFFDQVCFIEYSLRDVVIRMVNNSKIKLKETSLALIANELDDRFYRINRNVIINLDMNPIYSRGNVRINDYEFSVSRRNQTDLKIKILERDIYNVRKL